MAYDPRDPYNMFQYDFSDPTAALSNLGPNAAAGFSGGGTRRKPQAPPVNPTGPAATNAPAPAAAPATPDPLRAAFNARLAAATTPLAQRRAYEWHQNAKAGEEARAKMAARTEGYRESARAKNRAKKAKAQARLEELTAEVQDNPLSNLLSPVMRPGPAETVDQMNAEYSKQIGARQELANRYNAMMAEAENRPSWLSTSPSGYDKVEATRLNPPGMAQSTQPVANVNALMAQTPTGQLASVAQQSYPMDPATAELIRSAYGDQKSGLGSAIRAMNPQERGSFLNGLLRYPPEERRRILDRMAQEEIAKSNSFYAGIAPVQTPPARSAGGEMRAATQGEMDIGRRIQELVAGGVPQDDAFRIATTGQGPDLSELFYRELRALDERTPGLRLGTQFGSGLNFVAGEALGFGLGKLLPSRLPMVLNRGPQTRDLAVRGAPTPQAGRVTAGPLSPAGLLPEGVPAPAKARPMLDTATSGRTIITPPPQPKALPAAETSLARIAEPAAPAAKPQPPTTTQRAASGNIDQSNWPWKMEDLGGTPLPQAAPKYRVPAEPDQGLFPFAERATNPAGSANTNVVREFQIGGEGPKFQEIVDPQTGAQGSFTIFRSISEPSRPIVFVNVDGKTIPFYRSSSGTGGKTAGSWYPLGGFDEAEEWLVKGGMASKGSAPKFSVDTGYGNPAIQETMSYLNNRYGTLNLDEAVSALERDFGSAALRPGEITPYAGKLKIDPIMDQNMGAKALVNRGALREETTRAGTIPRSRMTRPSSPSPAETASIRKYLSEKFGRDLVEPIAPRDIPGQLTIEDLLR